MWERHRDSTFHAGGGLHILPRDMAKLGILYMNSGVYDGKRIINESWFGHIVLLIEMNFHIQYSTVGLKLDKKLYSCVAYKCLQVSHTVLQ